MLLYRYTSAYRKGWILLRVKRVLLLLLAVLLVTQAALFVPRADADGLDVFRLSDDQIRCTFEDVPKTAWYYPYAAYGQSLGLIQGKTATQFVPKANMTVAEAIVLGVRIFETYHGIEIEETSSGGAWYQPYIDRALLYGLIPEGCDNYSDPVLRDQAAAIFYRILPQSLMVKINNVNYLPDVDATNPYFQEILALYRMGVFTGNDPTGAFAPKRQITRAELTKIVCALINPDLRARQDLGSLSVFADRVSGSAASSFTDVPKSAWYHNYVAVQEQLGIVKGMGDGTYRPGSTVTYAQALKVAVEIYETYYNVTAAPSSGGTHWYDSYVERALKYGIIIYPRENYEEPAIRGDIAVFLYRSIDSSEFKKINTVDAIPDLPSTSFYYPTVKKLYEAGVMRGSDEAGSANVYQAVTRAELAALLTRLLLPAYRETGAAGPADNPDEVVYGTSGSGKYPLTAIKLGSGKNVLVLSFAIHGWEGGWARDGAELVSLADTLTEELQKNRTLLQKGDWTVYVLRCLNPDGLYDGSSDSGPGRCTTTCFNEKGELVAGKGMDLNRCFPYQFKPNAGVRTYNGTSPLQCVEARALSSFMQSVMGSGVNLHIDVQGWDGQILTGSEEGIVYTAVKEQFPSGETGSLRNGSGYFAAWTGYKLGYESCLLSLPYSITDHDSFIASGATERLQLAVKSLLGKTVK